MKKVFGTLLCVLALTGCSTSHLTDGSESVVKFTEGGISAEDLYEALKEKYGYEELITLMDTELLSKEYKTDDDEKEYIKTINDSLKEQWADDYETNIYSYYGVSTEDELKEYIRLIYRKNKWLEEYAKEQVTDTEINDYYENVTIGDITASHILIKVDTNDDMTDDEVKQVEEEALAKAKEVITKLNNGEKFEDLAKEYSDDTATSSNGGSLGAFNYDDNYDENFMEAAVNLEVGEYSSEPVKSTFGYHIIYKTAQDDKPELDDVKDEIIETIAEENVSNDTTLATKSIIALREKYGVEITDTDIKKEYEENYGD